MRSKKRPCPAARIVLRQIELGTEKAVGIAMRWNPRQTARGRPLPEDEGPELAEGLAHRGFVGLAILFFCTSFNDNAYRWLVIPIGYELLGPGYEGLVLSVGLACFVLPYTLLPAPAGYLADRFSKRSVMAGCMIGQMAVIGLGLWAILDGNIPLVFFTLTLMGVQGGAVGSCQVCLRSRNCPAGKHLGGQRRAGHGDDPLGRGGQRAR